MASVQIWAIVLLKWMLGAGAWTQEELDYYFGEACQDVDQKWPSAWSIEFLSSPQVVSCEGFKQAVITSGESHESWCTFLGAPSMRFFEEYGHLSITDIEVLKTRAPRWSDFFNATSMPEALNTFGRAMHEGPPEQFRKEYRFGPDVFCCACGAGGYCLDGHMKDINQMGCVPCGWGKYAPERERLDFVNEMCRNCEAGKYTAEGANSECNPCAAGRYTPNVGSPTCLACPSGRFSSPGSVRCDACSPGRYARAEATAECVGCPAGRHQSKNGTSFCDDCPAGKYSQLNATMCHDCLPGTYTPREGTGSCKRCEPGSFTDARGSLSCRQCSVGYVAKDSGMTVCAACGAGRASEESWTTMQKLEGKSNRFARTDEWVYLLGASKEKDCGCNRGLRLQDGECIPCGEGMTCPGMGEVWILAGYYSASPVSVYHCFNDTLSCPGGLPGHTCAEGREGISCAKCEESKKPGRHGSCVQCVAADKAPAICVCIVILFGLGLTYYVLATTKKVVQSHAWLVAVIACSQFLTWVQQMGIIGFFAISYEDPIETLFETFGIFMLDIEVLNIGCISRLSPVVHMMSKVFALFAGLAFLTLLHIANVLFFHRGQFRKLMHTFISAVGTLCFLTLIIVVSSVLAPLQCTQHPNGDWTVRTYKDVTCWQSSDHSTMVLVGLCGLSIPTAFFTATLYIAWQLPRRIHKGDVAFMETYGFLFFRFRPGAGWYISVILARSFLIALVPVVPNPPVQIMIFAICHQASLMLVMCYKPWGVDVANYSDIACSLTMLMVLNLASFFLHERDLRTISWMCIVMLICAIAMVLLAFLRPLMLFCARKRNPYRFFLCHHKARAGAFARLLKETLVDHPMISRDVFLDSDNLKQLNDLFHTVAYEIDTLLIIGTKDVFLRPWCAGEMTIARLKSIHVVILAMPDWQAPSTDIIENFEKLVDMSPLTENRLSLSMVQKTLAWIGTLPVIEFPRRFNLSTIDLLARALVADQETTQLDSKILHSLAATSTQTTDRRKVQILVDDVDMEAVAAAHILMRLTLPHNMHNPDDVPSVLLASDGLPAGVETIIIICTNGCFDSQDFLAVLVQAFSSGAKALPVVVESNFRFPSLDFLEGVRNRSWVELGVSGDHLADIISGVFTEIAIIFQPQHAPNAVLRTSAQHIAERVGDGSLRTIQNSMKRITIGISSERSGLLDRAASSKMVLQDSLQSDKEESQDNESYDDRVLGELEPHNGSVFL